MTYNDNRIPLPGSEAAGSGCTLKFDTFTCTNIHLFSDAGASGLVYKAVSEDYYGSDSYTPAQLIIKECYPIESVHSLSRKGTKLKIIKNASDSDLAIYEQYKERFRDTFNKHTKLYQGIAREQITVPNKCFETNGTTYMISDVSNGDTFDISSKTMDVASQLKVLIRLSEILSAMHESGYVYLDLKPQNVLTVKNTSTDKEHPYTGEIKLFDFDTVTAIDDLGKPGVIISGSGDWSSFEQTHPGNENKVGITSDIYSIGALLFWLVFDKPPTANEVIHAYGDWKISKESINHPIISKASNKTILHLCNIFNKTLVIDTASRYQDVSSLIRDLRELFAAYELKSLNQQLKGSSLRDDNKIIIMADIAKLKSGWVEEFYGKPYKDITSEERKKALGVLEDLGDTKGRFLGRQLFISIIGAVVAAVVVVLLVINVPPMMAFERAEGNLEFVKTSYWTEDEELTNEKAWGQVLEDAKWTVEYVDERDVYLVVVEGVPDSEGKALGIGKITATYAVRDSDHYLHLPTITIGYNDGRSVELDNERTIKFLSTLFDDMGAYYYGEYKDLILGNWDSYSVEQQDHMLMVMGAHYNDKPNLTYAEAWATYFRGGTWTCYKMHDVPGRYLITVSGPPLIPIEDVTEVTVLYGRGATDGYTIYPPAIIFDYEDGTSRTLENEETNIIISDVFGIDVSIDNPEFVPLPLPAVKEGWKRSSLENVGSIDIPPTMAIDVAASSKEYKSFIPIDYNDQTDNLIESARISSALVFHENEYNLGLTFDYSGMDFSELDADSRTDKEEGLIEHFDGRMQDWFPVQLETINGMSCMHYQYTWVIDGNSTIIMQNEYSFYSDDRAISLFISYPVNEEEKWKDDFEYALSTFRIN